MQNKLRAEVTVTRKEADGDLDYDVLMGLPYLDANMSRDTACVPARDTCRSYVSIVSNIYSKYHVG